LSLIRRLLPDAAIGADVIVGFPGEADADFRATVEFIERLPFTYLHVFSFSTRPGTSVPDSSARAGITTTSSIRSPRTTNRAGVPPRERPVADLVRRGCRPRRTRRRGGRGREGM
jgi:hypothetical protein